ncbi:peptidase S9 [Steroidobacter agaridevorans]|uniref:Peptidase S9 n=1 Tax=Steroidobacter agaridevorans TaxID=2695856 RepID=A0A829YDG1_9GAMM|nr:S9 family peptidase [Steroidobacter agaridevorans]GFE81319.1 peptidase S9 [Steroidobacter agaridevorans]GFE88799.1 peptidase S9 [Steroidobacter agaridevorans]
MRQSFAPAACALSACLLMPLGALAAPHPFNVEDLVRMQRVSEPVLSPDGRTAVFTMRETDLAANRGRTDLWALDIATKGAQPRRLTTHPEGDSSPEWTADGREIYFLSTRSGSSQVWRLPANGGEAIQVTDLPLDVGSFHVASQAGRLAVTLEVFPDCNDLPCTVDRLKEAKNVKDSGEVYDRLFVRHWDAWSDGRISQLFVLQLSNGAATEPVSVSKALDADVPSKPFGDASEYTFSPDGSRLVFSTRLKGKSEPWSTNFDLYEVGVDGSGLRNLTEDNPAWDTQPVFSRDGSQLAWRAMERAGFEADRFHVVVMDLKSGQRRALTKEWDRSVDGMAFANDGKTLFVTTDHFGQHPLWSVEVKTGKPTMLTGPGRVEAFSVGEKEIVLTTSSLKSPAELQALTIKGGDLRALPRMNEAALAEVKLGEPEQFTFAGAEGATVYGFVMKPADFKPGTKYPVAFIIHGGPQGSFANSWSYRWNPQTYAGAGYASVFIDFHGSTGYGQAFTDSISQDWGGKPLEDLQKGLAAALDKYQWLDGARMCALGASYGGYMINWIAGNWAEPFKCLVNHDGVFDSRAMAYSTEELWFTEWEQGGIAWEVPENVEKFNPVNHVANWNKPMLVIHGTRDHRIPYAQGLSAFTALQRKGIPSRLLMFPDENHWVLKPNNSIRWHHEVQKWLNEWTGKSGE